MTPSPKIFYSLEWKKRVKTSSQTAVLFVLFCRAQKYTYRAKYPASIIAENAHCSVPTVKRAIYELELAGALTVNRTTTHELIKGRAVIKRHNEYDLSIWSKYLAKTVQNDTSQKSAQVKLPHSGGNREVSQ